MVDEGTKKTLALIPLLKTKAGPRDGELWVQRLKEEYQSLIAVRSYFVNVSDIKVFYYVASFSTVHYRFEVSIELFDYKDSNSTFQIVI